MWAVDEAPQEESARIRTLKCHVGSTRHQQGKKVLEAQKSKQQSIAVAMKKVNDDIHVKGETLPEKELVFRYEVVQTFLRADVPLSKVQHFRPLLERGGSRLADRSILTKAVFAGNLASREEPYSASDCWTSGGSDF